MNAPLPDAERPSFREDPVPAWVGSRRGNPKLTLAQVEEIRNSDEKGYVLAERFGVSNGVVSRVRLNTAYVDPDYEPSTRFAKTSKIKGVYFDASIGRWRATTQKDGVRTHHGAFRTEQEAAAAIGRSEMSYELRAWIARRKREMNGEPLTLADKEQLRRHLEDL